MKKKIVWLVISCLMVAALVLASCGPAEEEEEEVVVPPEEEEVVPEEVPEEVVVEEEVIPEEEADMVKITAVKRDGTVVEKWVEKPRYGGVFIQATTGSPSRFDEALGMLGGATLSFTNEELLGADWTKGPAGTNEVSWMYTPFPMEGYIVGRLAESWEMPDADTFVWHIRKGVYYHDKPPVNGRELTADDIVFSLLRMWQQDTPRSFNALNYPWDSYLESITAPDKWTVIVKTKPGVASRILETFFVTKVDYPREVVEKYGDLKDWKNSAGTGPFMLVDYVADSSWTLERNPNYWMKDPLHPENTLPYVDGIKTLIIPDRSTRMAALRTAKLDWLSGITWEDAERFTETNPELKSKRYLGGATGLYMRVDKRELPFYDKRVRHALALAINNQEIADTIYGGQAEILFWPVAPIPYLQDAFTPLEELPESSRQLYEYHPDKARQLLEEAGYPDGFKTEIVALSTEVDLLSIVKEYWAKIGVELTIDVRETVVKTVVGFTKSHKEMFSWSTQGTIPYTMIEIRKGYFYNFAMIDDPVVEEAWDTIATVYFNEEERSRLMKELTPHLIDQSYIVVLPAYYHYTIWQPWVKNYLGEIYLSTADADFPRWIWLDQDLKEEMTGRR